MLLFFVYISTSLPTSKSISVCPLEITPLHFLKMTESLDTKMGEVSLNGDTKYERTPFGKEMLKHFLFDPTYKNLNHGTLAAMFMPQF